VRIDVFSIFPEFFAGPFDTSLLGRARTAGLLDLRVHDPREFATDRHRTVDDTPYGGGAGMVMTPGPLFEAVEAADPPRPLFLLAAGGRTFDQALARELAAESGFSLLWAVTRATTNGWPTTSAMLSCRTVTSCSRAARRRRSR
jgi:tRNA (guanine37-N1)-methyltransferase